ncbi:MAG TPA: phenylalanine--tRNA ligase subunit beta, partial [Longimicrobiales bacterium]|nr:phenylalanine--tRNA ligase subunit beta [Longimicrobiales bacterium]
EIAAAEGLPFALHALPGDAAVPDVTVGDGASVSVRIDDVALCPRYLGLVIRGVRVGPSPAWLASRLRVLGLRPISKVVDATNWVLHELGQPMHAFDLDRLGNEVVVRRARPGERITTLDGQDRALAGGMLVIADANRPVAIAGVMGGADTEVTDDTVDILLECALFEAKSVRGTRRALGLSTDASYRFERGVNPDAMMQALERAAGIIVRVAGGTVEPVVAAAGPGMPQPAPVRLRLARVEQVLGERFDAAAAAAYLRPLGFDVVAGTDDNIALHVPGHRRYDVSREEDLVEEIARRHGYDTFPDELRPYRPSAVPTHPLFLLEDRLRTLLVGRGFMEAHTAAFGPAADGDVELMLPLAATESRLRGSLLPGLVRRVESNFARGARSIRLFEIGTAFARGDGDLPRETTRLAIVFTGLREPPHWSTAESVFDVWDLKGLAADIGAALGLTLAPADDGNPFDPGVAFSFAHGDSTAGHAGRVRAAAIDAPAWADDVWALELVLDDVATNDAIRFRDLPQQPAVERDLALLVRHDMPAGAVLEAIRDAGGPLLETVAPFDLYAGKGVPEDRRSIAVRLRFRAPDRTLTDAEVDTVVRRVLQRLNDDLGVEQRA